MMLMALCSINAQEYKPTDTWPFVYLDFQPGMTRAKSGATLTEAKFNITVNDGRLMYIGKDDVIMQLDMNEVYTARVGDDVYVNLLGKMYKLLSELDCGAVVEGVDIDVDEMNKVQIGYGVSSSSASANNVTILMDGRFNLVNKSVQQASAEKYKGNVVPIKTTSYIVVNGILIPASRQEISSYPGVDKKAATDFFKKEKIKWKEVSSLEKVLVFVSEQLSHN